MSRSKHTLFFLYPLFSLKLIAYLIYFGNFSGAVQEHAEEEEDGGGGDKTRGMEVEVWEESH